MSNASFWLEAQVRTKKVLDEASELRKAVRDKNFMWARHLFIKVRGPVEYLRELFEGGMIAVGSDCLENAIIATTGFTMALNGYGLLRAAFSNNLQSVPVCVENWYLALEFMHAQIKEKQKEVAMSN